MRDVIINNLLLLLFEILLFIVIPGTYFEHFYNFYLGNIFIFYIYTCFIFYRQLKIEKNKILYNYLSFVLIIFGYYFFIFSGPKEPIGQFLFIGSMPILISIINKCYFTFKNNIQKTKSKKRKKGYTL